MAKKPTSASRSGKSAKTAAKSRGGAKGKAAVKAKSGSAARKKVVAKPKAAVKAKAAAKPKAAARPAARRSASRPAFHERQQPETLRCLSTSLSLTVEDLARSMKFYVDGVGFHVKDRWERDGELLGVELVAGACMVGLSQDDWAKGRDRVKGLGVRFYLETSQDIDAVAARMRSRGVEAVGPETAPWGARVLHLTDPDGFQITLFREQAR